MIHRSYSCDLCGVTHKPDNLHGVFWEGGKNGEILTLVSARKAEHHLCGKCYMELGSLYVESQEPQRIAKLREEHAEAMKNV